MFPNYPPARGAPQPGSEDIPSREPSVTTTLKGLMRFWPIFISIFGALISLYLQVVRLEQQVATSIIEIAAVRTSVAEKAAASDVARLESALQRSIERQDRREEITTALLADNQRVLERICVRMKCER